MPRALKHAATGFYTSNKQVLCDICGQQYNSRGIASHKRSKHPLILGGQMHAEDPGTLSMIEVAQGLVY